MPEPKFEITKLPGFRWKVGMLVSHPISDPFRIRDDAEAGRGCARHTEPVVGDEATAWLLYGLLCAHYVELGYVVDISNACIVTVFTDERMECEWAMAEGQTLGDLIVEAWRFLAEEEVAMCEPTIDELELTRLENEYLPWIRSVVRKLKSRIPELEEELSQTRRRLAFESEDLDEAEKERDRLVDLVAESHP